MDALIDKFIEFSQWAGTREEAQAHIEAANGNLDLALALIFDEGNAPTASSSNLTTQNPKQSPVNVSNKSLMEEMNEEYTKDLVRDVAPRVSPSKTVYCVETVKLLAIFKVFDVLAGLLLAFIPSTLKPVRSMLPPQHVNATYYEQTVLPVIRKRGGKVPKTVLSGATYVTALEKIKTSFTHLLVVITSDIHGISSPDVISKVLSMPIANRNDVNIWFTSAQSVEGLKIAAAFGASSLPFVALIAPSPKSAQSSVIIMSKLVQASGSSLIDDVEIGKFNDSALMAITDHEPKLFSLKLERERFDIDRSIKEQQDSAYQRSLEKDRQRAQALEDEKRAAELHELQLSTWKARVVERASLLDTVTSVAGGTKECARISLRFPDGTRSNFSVPGDSPISDIYNFAYVQLNPSIKDTPTPTNICEIPENFEAPYGFSLVSNVTRSILPVENTAVNCVEASWPNGVFMVDID